MHIFTSCDILCVPESAKPIMGECAFKTTNKVRLHKIFKDYITLNETIFPVATSKWFADNMHCSTKMKYM